MVPCDAEGIGGSERRNIRIGVAGEIPWPRHRRFEKTKIAQSRSAAMLRKLHVVDGQGVARLDPDPRSHLASSRKTFRRRFMTLRATSMRSSKAGSYAVMRKPSGEEVKMTVSPFSTFKAASASLGRINPSEFPICVT